MALLALTCSWTGSLGMQSFRWTLLRNKEAASQSVISAHHWDCRKEPNWEWSLPFQLWCLNVPHHSGNLLRQLIWAKIQRSVCEISYFEIEPWACLLLIPKPNLILSNSLSSLPVQVWTPSPPRVFPWQYNHCDCITVYLKVQMSVTVLWGDLVNEIRVNGTLILLVHFLYLCWGPVLLFEINPQRFLFISKTFVSFATEFQIMLCPGDLLS